MKIAKYDTEKAFDYENGFYLTSKPYRMGNMLAHYELYKKIVNLPGDVVELGVFKGGSLIQFDTFRELLENQNSRKIIGFDVFGKFLEENSIDSDKKFAQEWNEKFADEFVDKIDIENSLSEKKFENIYLVKGMVEETLDKYLKENPHTRIAMLHIDTDIYEPAMFGLKKLYGRIVPGGIIVLDDYAVVEGETVAADEFFADKRVKFNKFSFSHSKPTWIEKI